MTAPCGTSPLLGENVSTSPVLNNKILLWYRYVRMLATCYYTEVLRFSLLLRSDHSPYR